MIAPPAKRVKAIIINIAIGVDIFLFISLNIIFINKLNSHNLYIIIAQIKKEGSCFSFLCPWPFSKFLTKFISHPKAHVISKKPAGLSI